MGIPGNTVTAVLLGGLMIHGISPGPLIFEKNGVFMYAIFTALIVANIFMIIVEYAGLNLFVKLLDIPKSILLPIVMITCTVGAFAANNRMFDVWGIFVFGLIGLIFMILKIPTTPFIIGFILSPMAEQNLRRALMLSGGSITPFFTRPISLIFIALGIFSIIMSVKRTLKPKTE